MDTLALLVTARNIAVSPPAAMAPNTATPIAPAVCRTVFNTAEAVPDNDLSTLDRIPVVMDGTASPMPNGIIKNGRKSVMYGVFGSATNKPANPATNIVSPINIGGRIPYLLMMRPLNTLDITNPTVSGKKARPANSEL